MPPFLDAANLRNAIAASALPALEHLADNPDRLDDSLDRRFERDDPPPYASSSEDEAEVALHHPVLAGSADAALEKFRPLLSEPLSSDEVLATLNWLQMDPHAYAPGSRYERERKREDMRINGFAFQRGLDPARYWKGPRAAQRRAVIARRSIKRRWQRLGIWNPSWGIPGRSNPQPKDAVGTWQWAWQSSPNWRFGKDPDNPVRRALELRRNLAYGEHAPPPPRSHLKADASVSESESFITSRPWFVYLLESAEFTRRHSRIPTHQLGRRRDPDEDDPVTRAWKERGDWEPGWKWRHESPEPEQEDLTPLLTDEMEYTPSEVDALEAIPPRSPTPPPRPRADVPWKPARGSLCGRALDDPDTSEDEEPPVPAGEPNGQGAREVDEPPAAADEPEEQAMPEPEEEHPPQPAPAPPGPPTQTTPAFKRCDRTGYTTAPAAAQREDSAKDRRPSTTAGHHLASNRKNPQGEGPSRLATAAAAESIARCDRAEEAGPPAEDARWRCG